MDSLTTSEIAEIVRLQRDEGVQRLSGHFSWDDFDDQRCSLHQEFVYDVAVFAAHRGFSWADVIRAAGAAKSVFPRLHDLDAHKLLTLFKDVLPTLTPPQQSQFSEYLVDTVVARRRLFSAAAGRAREVSIARLDLDVRLPPTPCPLEQGADLREWEARREEARSRSALQEKREELSDGPRVSPEEVGVPEGNQLSDRPRQQADAATRGRHSSKPHSTTPVKAKRRSAKTRKQ